MTELACAQASLGEFDAARKSMEEIKHETGKTIALAVFACQLAQAGRVKDAMSEIDRLQVGVMQVHALTHLGVGLAKAGDNKAALASFERAHSLVGQLQKKDQRLQAENLAAARALAGDYKGALQTADAYPSFSESAYVNIAIFRAKAGDFSGAVAMCESIKRDPWWRLNVLRETAKNQALRGDTSAALEWIGRLNSHLDRANALMGAAEGTLNATPPAAKK
jgi:hypothetical protein